MVADLSHDQIPAARRRAVAVVTHRSNRCHHPTIVRLSNSTTTTINAMDHPKHSAALFEVYLRLRPSFTAAAERFLEVERCDAEYPKHITVQPPSDNRKRAVERFAFTRVFEEKASQLDLFNETGVLPLIEGVLGADGKDRDGLLATLGVTGSGKVWDRT